MIGSSFFVLWLLLLVSTTTVTSAFRTTTTTNSASYITTIHHRPQQSHYQTSKKQQQEQQRGISLLFSSTALTSPLQPVPEESSIIENSHHNNDSDNDDLDHVKMTTTTNSGIRGDTKIQSTKQQQKLEYIQSEGGRFSFNTKYGALNPFAIYYGVTSILLGLPWFLALTGYQLLQFITIGRFDRLRRIPVHLNQLWGESLLILTRCFPEMIHRDVLQKFYKEYVCVNSCSLRVWDVVSISYHFVIYNLKLNLRLYLFAVVVPEVDPLCLLRIITRGWIYHSWVQPLGGRTINSYPRRNWPRYRYWVRQLRWVDTSWYHGMIHDHKLKR